MRPRGLVCLAGLHPLDEANTSPRGGCRACAARKRREARAAARGPLAAFRPPAWIDDALCAQSDPDAWFPEGNELAPAAVRVCGACPVRAECLAYALDRDVQEGIWGGLYPRERRELARARRAERRAA